jgi:hypothetical protein
MQYFAPDLSTKSRPQIALPRRLLLLLVKLLISVLYVEGFLVNVTDSVPGLGSGEHACGGK